ncbi:uncharacterized protein LOC119662202 [Teleopsis dalmanni]|uniref:uncharacterized protein LOC119662202 n=1 Tax=Teleopsis dalmanni TaxID=139649 RepID=UPI0018CF8F6E|nr:uncharacterized protein LOC119662202 [Teleopsis dalmanni]
MIKEIIISLIALLLTTILLRLWYKMKSPEGNIFEPFSEYNKFIKSLNKANTYIVIFGCLVTFLLFYVTISLIYDAIFSRNKEDDSDGAPEFRMRFPRYFFDGFVERTNRIFRWLNLLWE